MLRSILQKMYYCLVVNISLKQNLNPITFWYPKFIKYLASRVLKALSNKWNKWNTWFIISNGPVIKRLCKAARRYIAVFGAENWRHSIIHCLQATKVLSGNVTPFFIKFDKSWEQPMTRDSSLGFMSEDSWFISNIIAWGENAQIEVSKKNT